MRLVLIRHGETAHNAERLALGREDVPLNERGSLQARAVAKAFRAQPAGEAPDARESRAETSVASAPGPFVAIYSSPLQRAVATATPLAEALGLDVQIEDGLIEMEVGEVEGLGFGELRERYPDFLRRWLSEELADVHMPGGESMRQVQDRAWAAVEALRDRHPEGSVVAVSHNFVVLTILCRVLQIPLARFRGLRHDLAAISVLELTPERQVVLTMNDRCHLMAEGLAEGLAWQG